MATRGDFATDVEPLAGLMRDHVEILELVSATIEAILAGLGAEGDAALAIVALESVRDLAAYLAEDLVVHIAKEEDVLFPALRGLADEMDKVVYEMVEQHDEVRLRKANIERTLAALDHSHEEVEGAAQALAGSLARAGSDAPTAAVLADFLDGVKRLAWILEGHFGDEEEDLFVPALELLSPETFGQLATAADALNG
ncbi:MAG: hemerythrin domain-containing protein [Anaerolineaceae bacterium]